ncbi:hypothetical protein [Streptomyces nigrescens]|uniref:hypothetical protein n=1 Tax=Streptomyces nigrescens TaxID=1920 RepID=UPI003478479B
MTRAQREHGGQGVAHSARVTRVGHFGQTLQQPRDLLGAGFGLLAELVKSGRDPG